MNTFGIMTNVRNPLEMSDKPFLDSFSNDFNVGDLVSWTEWNRTENFDYVSDIFYGAIIKIKQRKNIHSERSVWVAVVLPFGRAKTVDISLHLLKKILIKSQEN